MDMKNTRHAVLDTALGSLTIVATGEVLTGLYYEHHIRRLSQETLGSEVLLGDDHLLAVAAAQLDEYLTGNRGEFDISFDARGDAFQRSVWNIVSRVPFGATTAYGDIAQQLGDKSLAYRVGQAVGANPLCIFIPCHRVLGSDGKLTGYAGGLQRKRALLDLEEPAEVRASRLF